MAEQETTDAARSPLKRASTITQTIEDAKIFLKDDPSHLNTIQEVEQRVGTDSVKTKNGDSATKAESSPRKGTLQRTQTMVQTVEDAKCVLGDDKLGKTRSKDAAENTPAADEEQVDGTQRKSSLKRATTIMETVEDAKYVLGDEKLGKTRSKDAAENTPAAEKDQVDGTQTKSPLKRATTIMETVEEASHIVGDKQRGKTRSADDSVGEKEEVVTDGKSPLKRARTMDQTINDAASVLGDEDRGKTRSADK